ncbi:MAG TPA: trigger factor [bacterium]|nr:trigger factor [bacterium]
MKVEVIEKSKLGRELVFDVDREKVETEKNNIIREIKKDALVEGFRKGKVPEEIVKIKFAESIRENLLKRLIPDLYFEAIKEKNISVVVEPSVYDVNLNDEGLKFKAYTEIKPDVVIKKYRDIPVRKRKPETVTEEKVEEVLGQWEKKPEFSAAVIDPSKRRAWKEKIRGQLEDYSKMEAAMQEEQELWEGVLRETDCPVPERLVEERAVKYTEDHFRNLDLKNKSEEEKKKIAKEIFEKVKPIAEKDIRKYFVLDKIAELEKIEVTPKELDEKIESLSRSVGEPFEKVKDKLEKAGKLPDMEDEIRIDKAFNLLKGSSQKIEKVILPEEEKRIQTK